MELYLKEWISSWTWALHQPAAGFRRDSRYEPFHVFWDLFRLIYNHWLTILQLTHWLSIDATNSTLHTNDDLGWKALELSWLTIQGNRLWVDAFDWLALFLMMQFIYYSLKSNNERISIFPRAWSTLGVAIGCLALVDFIACCARFHHFYKYSCT